MRLERLKMFEALSDVRAEVGDPSEVKALSDVGGKMLMAYTRMRGFCQTYRALHEYWAYRTTPSSNGASISGTTPS